MRKVTWLGHHGVGKPVAAPATGKADSADGLAERSGCGEEFERAAGELLRADPVRFTVALTVLQQVRAQPETPVSFGWWGADGAATGALLWTDGYPVLLVAAPDPSVPALVDLLSSWRGASSVNGPTALAAGVGILLARRRSCSAVLDSASRLFRLAGALQEPIGVGGRARAAGTADLELLLAWSRDFAAEAGLPQHDPEPGTRFRLSRGGYQLWEADGRPVAMAAFTPPASQVSRIGPVYTPPEFRQRGYGSAATAAATSAAQVAGAQEVVLFTDLTNPVSNSIYPRLGYRSVEDRAVFRCVAG